jgi:hypothetical protein
MPNLFSFATSELSQDAFICWLLSWADDDYADSPLHQTGHDLIGALLSKHGYAYDSPASSIEIYRQHRDTDIVALLDEDLVLLIEDKVNTGSHSNQLSRYRSTLETEHPEKTVVPIFFKTRDQSSYEAAKEEGFAPFLRDDFLEVLRKGRDRGVESDIFSDYLSYLEGIHQKTKSFETEPVGHWPAAAWKGFYQILQDRLGDGSWGYVPNPSGGFQGFWWSFYSDDTSKQYLQLEEEKLCFKIEVTDEDRQKRLRQHWYKQVLRSAEDAELSVEKPARFGTGTHMTVAVYPGDVRAAKEDGRIDLGATLRRLRAAEAVLEEAVT